jgi:hypothetical protein
MLFPDGVDALADVGSVCGLEVLVEIVVKFGADFGDMTVTNGDTAEPLTEDELLVLDSLDSTEEEITVGVSVPTGISVDKFSWVDETKTGADEFEIIDFVVVDM